MKIFWTLEPQPRRNLLILFGTGLFFWSSLASLLPTLPPYIKDIGASDRQLGLVMGAFAIGLLLFRPTLGRIADQRGRKIVLVVGTIVAAIAPLGFLFVKSIPLLMVIRAFHGVSLAAFTIGYNALVVDLSPVLQRGELIGYMSLVSPVGLAIGPAIAGFLLAASGYTYLFLLASALGILSLFGISQVKESSNLEPTSSEPVSHLQSTPDQTTTQSQSKTSNQLWHLVFSPPLIIPALVLLLIGIAFGSLHTFIPLFIKETKVNFNAGWFYTVAAVASFSFRLVTGRASDRYGRGLFISSGLFAYGLAMFTLSQANSAIMQAHGAVAIAFLLAGLIEGAASGTLLPMMVALIADRSPHQLRGRIFALCISGFDLGNAIAGPIFGYFAGIVGYQGIFGLSTGLSLLALVLFISKSNQDFTQSCLFALGKGKDTYALKEIGS